MKTLVSRLSVACHHRSGKYSTWEWGGGDTGIGWGPLTQPSLAPDCQPLTSPAWMVHSRGRADSARAGYVSRSQASVVLLGWNSGVFAGGYRNQR